MPKPHVYDQIAEELAGWIDSTARAIADDLAAGGTAPFAAPISERDKLDYWRAQFFNDDGTPNTAGRQRVLEKRGVEAFARIYQAVMKQQAQAELEELEALEGGA